jgi:peptide/nickel transport system substrate-binding protein
MVPSALCAIKGGNVRLRSLFAIAGALTLCAGLVACGDDDSSSGTAGNAAATATTAGGGAGTSPAGSETSAAATTAGSGSAATGGSAAAATDPNGVLRIATFAITPWDPAKTATGYSITTLGLVFDRLVHNAPDGSLVPGLATKWEYSADGLTLTFTLRDGVKFQDGTPFDAAAVKANIDRTMTVDGSTQKPDLSRITQVVVVDPHTVQFQLASADATLPAVMSGPAGAMMSPASFADPAVDQHPVGAGMFKLVDYKPGASFAVERWDGYWDPAAVKLKRIEFVSLPDAAARINALKTGQVDIAPVEPTNVPDVQKADGVKVRLNKTLRYVYLAMNLADKPLDELKVRQAISYAIDRKALLDGLYGGYGTVAEQPWPKGYFPHVDGLDDTYPHDVAKAKQLLSEAGHADGFSADIIAVPSPAVYAQLGEAVQAQLADIGIKLTVKITEPAELGPAMYVNKTAAFALLYTNGSIDPANTVGTRYISTGFFNAGKYSTPKMEDLYKQAIATTDNDARTKVMQDVSREVVAQVLDMPLFTAQEPEGINDRVVGYQSWFTGRPEFRGVGVTG